jgi:RNA recognition motif-containing protein
VKNLPSDLKFCDLKNTFQKFGEVENCKIIDQQDKPKFALIRFKNGEKSAQQCADQAI